MGQKECRVRKKRKRWRMTRGLTGEKRATVDVSREMNVKCRKDLGENLLSGPATHDRNEEEKRK